MPSHLRILEVDVQKAPGHHPNRHRTSLLLVGLAALSTATLTICAGGAASASSSSALGKADPATGKPVILGLISDGGSGTVGTAPLVEQGARMAVAWANHYKGGLGGHPIQLFICENLSTPAGGQDCANQMVQKHVVAVTLPFTGQGPTEVPTIVKAGIPYITLSGSTTEETTTKGAYSLTGGLPGVLAADAAVAKARGYKKFAMLTVNVPEAIQPAETLGVTAFKKANVGFKVIPVNLGTADISPQLESAVQWGAQAIGMTGDLTLCTSFFQAYQTLGLKLPRFVLSTCVDPSIIKSSLDSVMAGSIISSPGVTSSPDYATYAAITKKFAPSVNPSPNVSTNQSDGASAIWALINIMQGYHGPVTPAGITKQITTAKNVVLPLSDGATFTCNGKIIPSLPSVCSVSTLIGTLKSNGQATDIKTINAAGLFAK
jgi:branched-chain amino acid transport system substrate-binding protein